MCLVHLSKKYITGRNNTVQIFNIWKVPKTVHNDATTSVFQGVDSGSIIKPIWEGSDTPNKIIHFHNSLNSNISRENWKPGDIVYIIIGNRGTNKLVVNSQDNYVRGIDTGEILEADGTGSVRGMVYDADGNNIQEPITGNWRYGGGYAYIRNRGFEEISQSTVMIRRTDSSFNLNRSHQDWLFFKINPNE